MRHKMIAITTGVLLSLASIHSIANHYYNVTTNSVVESSNNSFDAAKDNNGWIELGPINMSAFFDESWHWATATLYRLENTNLAYRVRYEDKYYTVMVKMEGGEVKCAVLIPYREEKRWFSFSL